MRTRARSWLLVAALVGLASSQIACASRPPPPPDKPAAPVTLTPAQIAAKANPAVVLIKSPTSLGTGFIIRDDGWIATNVHVIAGAPELVVILDDKSEHPVTDVLALDRERDLAIIKIEMTKKLPTLKLGDSDGVHPGDAVVAIGHPLGLEHTVSNGLVSAVRVVSNHLTILQISAPIAPGSSGGPLLNEQGDVIGVAAAVITEGQNLNLGIPAGYLMALSKHPDPIAFDAFVQAQLDEARPERRMPDVKRDVPHFELAVLQGCKDAEVVTMIQVLENAVEAGAPLYNSGNFAACYHVYEGASLDLERKIGPACKGPRKALADGRKRAAGLGDPASQAWAMRDAFDGLFDVLERKVAPQKSR